MKLRYLSLLVISVVVGQVGAGQSALFSNPSAAAAQKRTLFNKGFLNECVVAMYRGWHPDSIAVPSNFMKINDLSTEGKTILDYAHSSPNWGGTWITKIKNLGGWRAAEVVKNWYSQVPYAVCGNNKLQDAPGKKYSVAKNGSGGVRCVSVPNLPEAGLTAKFYYMDGQGTKGSDGKTFIPGGYYVLVYNAQNTLVQVGESKDASVYFLRKAEGTDDGNRRAYTISGLKDLYSKKVVDLKDTDPVPALVDNLLAKASNAPRVLKNDLYVKYPKRKDFIEYLLTRTNANGKAPDKYPAGRVPSKEEMALWINLIDETNRTVLDYVDDKATAAVYKEAWRALIVKNGGLKAGQVDQKFTTDKQFQAQYIASTLGKFATKLKELNDKAVFAINSGMNEALAAIQVGVSPLTGTNGSIQVAWDGTPSAIIVPTATINTVSTEGLALLDYALTAKNTAWTDAIKAAGGRMASDLTQAAPKPALAVGPVQQEPLKQEPVKQEPVQQEPVQWEPLKPRPVQQEPVRQEPLKPRPVQQEPVRQEPLKHQPIQQGPLIQGCRISTILGLDYSHFESAWQVLAKREKYLENLQEEIVQKETALEQEQNPQRRQQLQQELNALQQDLQEKTKLVAEQKQRMCL